MIPVSSAIICPFEVEIGEVVIRFAEIIRSTDTMAIIGPTM